MIEAATVSPVLCSMFSASARCQRHSRHFAGELMSLKSTIADCGERAAVHPSWHHSTNTSRDTARTGRGRAAAAHAKIECPRAAE